MPTKDRKGDTVLAVRFVLGGISMAKYWSVVLYRGT